MARTNFISCRLAPSTASPMGTPWPSVNRLRLTPLLARSVGFGPVFFPPERRLGHRAVHAQPVPVDALQLIKLSHPRLPEFQEDVCCNPLLKAVVGGGFGTQLGLRSGLPIGSRAEHVKNGIGTAAIRHARTATAKAVGIHPYWEQRGQNSPELLGDAEPSGRAVVGRRARVRFGSCDVFIPTSIQVIRIGSNCPWHPTFIQMCSWDDVVAQPSREINAIILTSASQWSCLEGYIVSATALSYPATIRPMREDAGLLQRYAGA